MRFSYWKCGRVGGLSLPVSSWVVGSIVSAEAELPVVAPASVLAAGPVVPTPRICIVQSQAIGDAALAWMPRAREQFAAWCAAFEAAAAGSSRSGEPAFEPAIWPRSSDVVSDVPSALSFLRSRPRWRLVFDPVGLLTSSMLPRVEEHLERLFAAFAEHPSLLSVVLTSARAEGEGLARAPLSGDDHLTRRLLANCSAVRARELILLGEPGDGQEALVRDSLERAL